MSTVNSENDSNHDGSSSSTRVTQSNLCSLQGNPRPAVMAGCQEEVETKDLLQKTEVPASEHDDPTLVPSQHTRDEEQHVDEENQDDNRIAGADADEAEADDMPNNRVGNSGHTLWKLLQANGDLWLLNPLIWLDMIIYWIVLIILRLVRDFYLIWIQITILSIMGRAQNMRSPSPSYSEYSLVKSLSSPFPVNNTYSSSFPLRVQSDFYLQRAIFSAQQTSETSLQTTNSVLRHCEAATHSSLVLSGLLDSFIDVSSNKRQRPSKSLGGLIMTTKRVVLALDPEEAGNRSIAKHLNLFLSSIARFSDLHAQRLATAENEILAQITAEQRKGFFPQFFTKGSSKSPARRTAQAKWDILERFYLETLYDVKRLVDECPIDSTATDSDGPLAPLFHANCAVLTSRSFSSVIWLRKWKARVKATHRWLQRLVPGSKAVRTGKVSHIDPPSNKERKKQLEDRIFTSILLLVQNTLQCELKLKDLLAHNQAMLKSLSTIDFYFKHHRKMALMNHASLSSSSSSPPSSNRGSSHSDTDSPAPEEPSVHWPPEWNNPRKLPLLRALAGVEVPVDLEEAARRTFVEL